MVGKIAQWENKSAHGPNSSCTHSFLSGPLSTTSPTWTTKCGCRSEMTLAILAVIFGGLYAYFKARGGYRAIQLGTDRPMATGEL